MHTFLSLDTDLIPQSTKDNVPSYLTGCFSNDGSRLLIDGYNESGEMAHLQSTFDSWLQWSDNPKEVQKILLAVAIEYTLAELNAERVDPLSIWYVSGED